MNAFKAFGRQLCCCPKASLRATTKLSVIHSLESFLLLQTSQFLHETHANVIERDNAHSQTQSLNIKMYQKLVSNFWHNASHIDLIVFEISDNLICNNAAIIGHVKFCVQTTPQLCVRFTLEGA
jgi:hypothetical protein